MVAFGELERMSLGDFEQQKTCHAICGACFAARGKKKSVSFRPPFGSALSFGEGVASAAELLLMRKGGGHGDLDPPHTGAH